MACRVSLNRAQPGVAYRGWMFCAAAILFALIAVGCSGPSPQVWWQIHTQCPVMTYTSLDWSPDGRQIAFSGGPLSPSNLVLHETLYLVEVRNRSRTRRLTDGFGSKPVWSPDGKVIEYLDLTDKIARIAFINADGAGQKRVGQLGYEVSAWSPDGSLLAATIYQDAQPSVALIDVSDLTPHVVGGLRGQVSGGLQGYDPDWSPDGRRLVFALGQIYAADMDGANVEQLTTTGDTAHPAWSPDGNTIAFVSGATTLNPRIDLLDLATGAITTLAGGFSPSWSPDSKQLAFISRRSGQTEIYTINVDGAGLTQLTYNPTGAICPH